MIPPGASQVVRLLLRKKKDLPPGEYRSHLYFQSVPPERSGEDIEVLAGDEKKIGVTLIPIFGLTIPVIVRHGQLTATADIVNPTLDVSPGPDHSHSLSYQILRTGNRSLFGDIRVIWDSPAGAENLEVARVNGIAVFTPNQSRTLTQTLSLPEGVDLTKGTLHIQYAAPGGEGGTLLAETLVPLP